MTEELFLAGTIPSTGTALPPEEPTHSLNPVLGAELVPGLEFALRNSMTPTETNVFLVLLRKPMCTQDIANSLGGKATTIHNTVLKLKYKGLIKEHSFIKHTKVFAVSAEKLQE